MKANTRSCVLCFLKCNHDMGVMCFRVGTSIGRLNVKSRQARDLEVEPHHWSQCQAMRHSCMPKTLRTLASGRNQSESSSKLKVGRQAEPCKAYLTFGKHCACSKATLFPLLGFPKGPQGLKIGIAPSPMFQFKKSIKRDRNTPSL